MSRTGGSPLSAAPIAVRFCTSLGDLVAEVYPDRAPRSAAAFLAAVDAGEYDGGSFARLVRTDNDRGRPRIEVVQAYARVTADGCDVPVESTTATGLRHEDGTLSLPRAGTGDGTARSFFICVGAQPALDAGGGRAGDPRGFAAFGRVVDGLEVVREIHRQPTSTEAPTEYVRGQLAMEPPRIYRAARVAASARAQLDALAADYWAFRLIEFPLEATVAGVGSENARLERVRDVDVARRDGICTGLRARAAAIDDALLDEEGATSLQIIRDKLESMRAAVGLREHRRPCVYPAGFTMLAEWLVRGTPLASLEARDDFAARLALLPAHLEDRLEQLRRGFTDGQRLPAPLVPRVLALLDAQLATEDGLLAQVRARLADGVPGAPEARLDEQRATLERVLSERVLPALRVVRAFFATLDRERLTEHIGLAAQPEGRAYYRFKVRQQTSVDVDPDEVHALGLAEVERVGRELDAVLAEMGRPGEARMVAEELNLRVAPDGGTLLRDARALAKRIDGLLPRLFGRFPRSPYAVESMGDALSGEMPPAFAQPAPADRSMPGVFWLTGRPDRCPLHLLPALTLHEAWPGHLMQLALAQELDDLPAFRRFPWQDHGAYVEGWALYCERLGLELGLYDAPEARFGLLGFELWRAARLVVDTGIHWSGWSRARAVDYLAVHTFLGPETIASEVDRYVGMPAQALSYKMGERVITRLRAEAERALGAAFSLRHFHDQVLATGPVPLGVLERRIRRWIVAGVG